MIRAGTRVLLGVSGGIAAYKAAELVRRLRDLGAEVRVVMSKSAAHFVGPATFQALSGNPVRSSLWDANAEAAMGHIELARWAQLILIAPASAHTLAKLAHGLSGDLLNTVCLASAAPLVVAPAMNQQMYAHAATQANLAQLQARGVRVLGPASGTQACGDVGPGRMLEVAELLEALRGSALWQGKRVVITAGPTYEDLDPVRYLGNRSSGKMGFAIAQAALEMGARVQLIAGPCALKTPQGAERTDVRSALQMREIALQLAPGADVFIASAAVADYRPQAVAPQKLKKCAEHLTFELVRNPDIVAEVAQLAARPFVVGFAAETEQVEQYARGKLLAKGLDLIAANQVGAHSGFEVESNALTLIDRNGMQALPETDKLTLARALLNAVHQRMTARP